MCHAKRCSQCGKTTWSGCGMHVDAVKATVPALEAHGMAIVQDMYDRMFRDPAFFVRILRLALDGRSLASRRINPHRAAVGAQQNAIRLQFFKIPANRFLRHLQRQRDFSGQQTPLLIEQFKNATLALEGKHLEKMRPRISRINADFFEGAGECPSPICVNL